MGTLIFILITILSAGIAVIAALLSKKRSRIRRMSKKLAKRSGKATANRMRSRSLYLNRSNGDRMCTPGCQQSRMPKALCVCQAKKCMHGKSSGVWGLLRTPITNPSVVRKRENMIRRSS